MDISLSFCIYKWNQICIWPKQQQAFFKDLEQPFQVDCRANFNLISLDCKGISYFQLILWAKPPILFCKGPHPKLQQKANTIINLLLLLTGLSFEFPVAEHNIFIHCDIFVVKGFTFNLCLPLSVVYFICYPHVCFASLETVFTFATHFQGVLNIIICLDRIFYLVSNCV